MQKWEITFVPVFLASGNVIVIAYDEEQRNGNGYAQKAYTVHPFCDVFTEMAMLMRIGKYERKCKHAIHHTAKDIEVLPANHEHEERKADHNDEEKIAAWFFRLRSWFLRRCNFTLYFFILSCHGSITNLSSTAYTKSSGISCTLYF